MTITNKHQSITSDKEMDFLDKLRDLEIQLKKSKDANRTLKCNMKKIRIELDKTRAEVRQAQYVVANMIDSQNSETAVTFTDELTREERALLSGDPLPSFMGK